MKRFVFSMLIFLSITHQIFSMASPRCLIIGMGESLQTTKKVLLEAQQKGYLVKLNLSYAGLEEIPDDFFVGVSNIVSLNLARNKLTRLPPMESLVHLDILNLEGNNFSVFPMSVYSLSSLSTLILSFNALTEIPEEIAHLHDLRVLNLMMNQITLLPESIGLLYGLEELYVSHNQLSRLPNSVGALTKLQILTLNDNNLQDLPESLISLIYLRSINIANNALTADVEWAMRLQSLQARGTKIIGLPRPTETAIASGAAASSASVDEITDVFTGLDV